MGAVRAPAVAGTFYPAGESDLTRSVDACLRKATVPVIGLTPRLLVVPHAGHVYSGPVAATAYRLLPPQVSTVALLGPSHFVAFEGVAVTGADAFATPLGPVPVDADLVARCLDAGGAIVDDRPHAREHSLEVHLPFLQRIVDAPSIVPLLTGEVAAPAAAVALEAALDGGAFGIISSDLSHYLDHETACRRDAATAAAITALRWTDLEWGDACGRTAIQAALIVAARRGWQCELLDLRTSGDTAGSRDRVVGYGAFVIGPPR